MTNRNVIGAGLIVFLLMGCGQGTMVQIILFLQDVLKYSPQQTGMALFPFVAMTLTSSFFINRLLDSIGFRKTIAIGLVFQVISLVWLLSINESTTYLWGFVPIMVVWNLGFPLASIGARLPAGLGIPEEKQGIAYGVHYAYEQLGMTFGITLLTEISVAAAHAHLGEAPATLIYGFRLSTVVSAVFMALALVANHYLLTNPKREEVSQTIPVASRCSSLRYRERIRSRPRWCRFSIIRLRISAGCDTPWNRDQLGSNPLNSPRGGRVYI